MQSVTEQSKIRGQKPKIGFRFTFHDIRTRYCTIFFLFITTISIRKLYCVTSTVNDNGNLIDNQCKMQFSLFNSGIMAWYSSELVRIRIPKRKFCFLSALLNGQIVDIEFSMNGHYLAIYTTPNISSLFMKLRVLLIMHLAKNAGVIPCVPVALGVNSCSWSDYASSARQSSELHPRDIVCPSFNCSCKLELGILTMNSSFPAMFTLERI